MYNTHPMAYVKTVWAVVLVGMATVTLVQGNHNNLAQVAAEDKMGTAVLRVDCPRNSNDECEAPITLSWETPYSKKQAACKNYEQPEYGEDEDFASADTTGITVPDENTAVDEDIYFTWRYESSNLPGSLDTDSYADDMFYVEPCELIDVPARKSFFLKYKHCKYDTTTSTTECSPEKEQEIKVAAYDKNAVNEKALPTDDNMVYMRTGVKFLGSAGQQMFPAYKFNASGFINAVVEAVNQNRGKCPPGESSCPMEYDEVIKKNVRIINVDDENNKKDVLYEVRVPKKDGDAIQGRVLHPYFKYPLAIKLVTAGLIPDYVYEPKLEIDASKAVLLKPKVKSSGLLSSKLAKMAAGIIVLIVVASIAVLGGAVYVAKKAGENRKVQATLDAKAVDLDKIDHQLQEKGKLLEIKEQQLNAQMNELKNQNEQMMNQKKALEAEEAKVQADRDAAQKALKDAEASGDAAAVEASTLKMSEIAARMKNIGKKKQDCSAEVERIQQEEERVRKELTEGIQRQKDEHNRKLQERLRARRAKANAKVAPGGEENV
jgi:hypothetical protein